MTTNPSSRRIAAPRPGHAAALLAAICGLGAALALPSGAAASPSPQLNVPAFASVPVALFAQRHPAACRTSVQLVRSVQLVQDDDDGADDSTTDKGVAPAQIEKYVAVYRAMQTNHNLTVEQAAATQGFTVQAFRDLEHRIESDDLARDDARNALAAPASDGAPQGAPASQR